MNNRKRSTIWLHFVGIVFGTILLVFFSITLIWFLLFELDIIESSPQGRKAPLLLFLFGSVLLGGIISLYVGRVIIRPVQNIGKAFQELSGGNFSVKVSENEKIAEIREIARQFNAMTYDLSHIETLRTDFVVNVSHEIKTPISSIEGYATLLQNPNLSEEKRAYYVKKILDNSCRLSSLTSNMLLLSKLENQELVLKNKSFRLDEQIRKTILLLEDKWSEKSIQFDMELPIKMYYGSEQLLGQVWSNIIGNAIKHSEKNGIIEIRIEDEQSAISVEIADHGEGMTPDVMKHVFEKFYQGDASRKTEGNGLGLPLAKRIIDICGGEICVQSEVGKGSVFTVRLPIK